MISKVPVPRLLKPWSKSGNFFVCRPELAGYVEAVPSNQLVISLNHGRDVKAAGRYTVKCLSGGEVGSVNVRHGVVVFITIANAWQIDSGCNIGALKDGLIANTRSLQY